MSDPSDEIAIVGGGMAGLALALCLHQQRIPSIVYEARPVHPPARIEGAVVLAPNALRILEGLGVYERIVSRGFSFENVWHKTADEVTTERFPIGNEGAYGYKALRIYRRELLDVLYQLCQERGIRVQLGAAFGRVLDDSAEGVTFALSDGNAKKASLLVGADGLWSKVRENVAPGAELKFLGLGAVSYSLPASKVRIPEGKDYQFPCILSARQGPFVLAYQTANRSEMLAATHHFFEDRDADGWAELLENREALASLLRQDMGKWPDVVESALEEIDETTLNVWPYYHLARVERWVSQRENGENKTKRPRLAGAYDGGNEREADSEMGIGRVVIIGDAAHALPPTAGQGASQAFEDAMSLALVLSKVVESPKESRREDAITLDDALVFWQDLRQERLRRLAILTQQLNNRRLPASSTNRHGLSDDEIWADKDGYSQLEWLYRPDIEERIEAWARA